MKKTPETVITIIGALNSNIEKRAAQIVRETCAEEVSIKTLHPNHAIDIIVNPYPKELTTILYENLAKLGSFDVFIQPNDEFRKKKMLICDMEGTVIQQELLDELSKQLNLGDEISNITEKAMRGEIDFNDALIKRVKLLKDQPIELLLKIRSEIKYSPGADELIKTMNYNGAKCILISGGIDFFTEHVAKTLGFSRNYGNKVGIKDGKLTGEVIPPIIDKHAKYRLVIELAKELGCDIKQVMTTGDGANDIPMLQIPSLVGVGYYGKLPVQEATPHQVNHTNMKSVLYMQGYDKDDIERAQKQTHKSTHQANQNNKPLCPSL
ncbi:MAG: phosphoserine phosphatase SerB [Alphaproteobacteria bacterium]|nr:phosphoserine phosphatase SerB [Alphaproteobacteria bacterium]